MFHVFFTGSEEIQDKHNKRRELNEDNLKYAKIKVCNTERLAWVNNKTNKAYKMDGYAKTNIEIKKFTFIRWATGFDL